MKPDKQKYSPREIKWYIRVTTFNSEGDILEHMRFANFTKELCTAMIKRQISHSVLHPISENKEMYIGKGSILVQYTENNK